MIRVTPGLIACCCAAAMTTAAAPNDTAQRSITMPLTDSRLLQTATALAASTTTDAAALGKALGITFTQDTQASTRFFTVYKGRASTADAVDTVEIRTPAQPGPNGEAGDRGPLIILTLKPRTALTGRQVMALFGVPDELHVPPPQAASTGAAVYVYKLKKTRGEMRVALGAPPAESVLSVVIDRTE